MKSTKEIYEDIKAKYIQCNVTAAHVEAGWTFFCTQSGSWGVQTGTLATPTPTPTRTPTITPTSTPTPWQGDNVVAIGGMWVAKWTNNAGTASNAIMQLATALGWAGGLNWLGRTGWRLPKDGELSSICASKGSLGAYELLRYWTSDTTTEMGPLQGIDYDFSNCARHPVASDNAWHVRAVRSGD